MPRILEPGQIEAFAQRGIPRIRLPERTGPFAARAQRLRQLGATGAPGQAIGDYLRLMARLVEAQDCAVRVFEVPLPAANQLEQSRAHRMPLVLATGIPRAPAWRDLAAHLCGAVAGAVDAPAAVRDTLQRLQALPPEHIEAQADALLAGRREAVEAAAAPFLMAALQVYWVGLASRLKERDMPGLEVPGVCPTCGTQPVASIVRADEHSQGYRYLHCGLCATEWHLVRVTCSHCQNTAGITYHSIEGGLAAIRAESCDQCHTYRKILYQERDAKAEPVADDLASLALDLLMTDAGYHRGSGNPLLWQSA
jgi:FdhE protein